MGSPSAYPASLPRLDNPHPPHAQGFQTNPAITPKILPAKEDHSRTHIHRAFCTLPFACHVERLVELLAGSYHWLAGPKVILILIFFSGSLGLYWQRPGDLKATQRCGEEDERAPTKTISIIPNPKRKTKGHSPYKGLTVLPKPVSFLQKWHYKENPGRARVLGLWLILRVTTLAATTQQSLQSLFGTSMKRMTI